MTSPAIVVRIDLGQVPIELAIEIADRHGTIDIDGRHQAAGECRN